MQKQSFRHLKMNFYLRRSRSISRFSSSPSSSSSAIFKFHVNDHHKPVYMAIYFPVNKNALEIRLPEKIWISGESNFREVKFPGKSDFLGSQIFREVKFFLRSRGSGEVKFPGSWIFQEVKFPRSQIFCWIFLEVKFPGIQISREVEFPGKSNFR